MAAEDLPEYSEMIMTAIDALDDKDGSNKTAINEHIVAEYGEQLPEDYYAQLSDQLNQMKESGELIQVKNNYMKPGSYVPPKRGRGRPPKDKIPVPEGYAVGPARPRGRPPKIGSSPKKASATGSGKPRGRPPKKVKVAAAEDGDEDESDEEVRAAPVKTARGRGRPPKVKNLDAQVVA